MYTLLGKPICLKHYTYMLVDPTSKKPFYVGKGSGKRYLDHFKEAIVDNGVNKYKTNTIKKILQSNKNVIVEIVLTSDNPNDCYNQEMSLIAQYGRKNNKSGILTNLTDGGEGGSYLHSEEHKQSLREHNPGGLATSKTIYQIDATTGKVVNTWASTRKAGLALGIQSWRNISNSANHHKHRTVGGYFWRWTTDKDIADMTLKDIEELNTKRLGTKKVICKNIAGDLVEIYNSLGEAAKIQSIPVSSLSTAIKRKRPINGLLCEYLID